MTRASCVLGRALFLLAVTIGAASAESERVRVHLVDGTENLCHLLAITPHAISLLEAGTERQFALASVEWIDFGNHAAEMELSDKARGADPHAVVMTSGAAYNGAIVGLSDENVELRTAGGQRKLISVARVARLYFQRPEWYPETSRLHVALSRLLDALHELRRALDSSQGGPALAHTARELLDAAEALQAQAHEGASVHDLRAGLTTLADRYDALQEDFEASAALRPQGAVARSWHRLDAAMAETRRAVPR
ncbi:MAG: hypothetical protein HYV63_30460 [Candidatus Schekmanbacteria bacterium]|nr:hypothetical protein [Candidatus Schekmanbacteria bacterium]